MEYLEGGLSPLETSSDSSSCLNVYTTASRKAPRRMEEQHPRVAPYAHPTQQQQHQCSNLSTASALQRNQATQEHAAALPGPNVAVCERRQLLLQCAITIANDSLGTTLALFNQACTAAPGSPAALAALQAAEATMAQTARMTGIAALLARRTAAVAAAAAPAAPQQQGYALGLPLMQRSDRVAAAALAGEQVVLPSMPLLPPQQEDVEEGEEVSSGCQPGRVV